MTTLYPPPRVLRTHALPVSGGHVLHVQESGSGRGLPALVLHGGPGSGCSEVLTRFFDPARYRVICMDQRGAGSSRPAGGLEHNSKDDLLQDLRALLTELGIELWLVVGGSLGATLALLHALDAPEAVAGLLLRNVFLARAQDVERFFGLHTEAGQAYWHDLVVREDGSLVEALARVFQASPLAEQQAVAQRWWQWECRLAGMVSSSSAQGLVLEALMQRYRIQSHYLRHGCWLRERPLLARCAAAPHVPTLLLHGTCDEVCPLQGALELQQCMPHATLLRIPGAGHDPMHPAMVAAMRAALDAYAVHERWELPASLSAHEAAGAGSP